MKNKWKINLNDILQALCGFVFGAGIGTLYMISGVRQAEDKPAGYGILLILSLLVLYYLSVIVHELTHFITFRIYGIEMKLLIMGPFICMRKNNKWNFRFKLTRVFAMGGIAVPNLHVIDSEEKIESFRKAFSRVLVAAPISNLVLNAIAAIVIAASYRHVDSMIGKSYLIFILISITFISIFLNLTSLVKNDLVIGDYRACFEIFKSKEFAYTSIFNYMQISDKYSEEQRKYVMKNVLLYLENALSRKSFSSYYIGIADSILCEYLSGRRKELPEEVKNYIAFAEEDCEIILKAYSNPELPLILLHHIVMYHNLEEHSKQKAIELYNRISMLAKHKTKVLSYYNLRSRHVLGIEDNLQYISNRENIRSSSLYELWSMFDWYFEEETRLLERQNNSKGQ